MSKPRLCVLGPVATPNLVTHMHFTNKKKPKCAHGHNTAHTSVRVDSRQSDMEIQVPQYTLSRRLKR